ncbi:alkaline phosphatase D family protein [soil metagenome]
MKNLCYLVLLTLVFLSSCNNRKTEDAYVEEEYVEPELLLAGPMLGYVEHREAMVWVEVSHHVNYVTLEYFPLDTPSSRRTIQLETYNSSDTSMVFHFTLTELRVNSEYEYELYLNSEKQKLPYVTRFKTRPLWEYNTDAPPLTFLFGSCNYINDSVYDRPGDPYGKDVSIFETMAEQNADFMLWLGDNTYFRPADYSSTSGMAYRYRHTRILPELQPLLAAMSHYAIWDDHDYGTNDGDKTFQLKQESLQLFKRYWANKTYGEENNSGIYSRLQMADAEFYLLDDRYHRSPNGYPAKHSDKEFLGKQQLQWLKESLLSSDKNLNFRFIVVGNQVLNPTNQFECYRNFESEWQELMDFIVQHRIEGVVFLSGDRHFTEINFFQPGKEFYRLYDVTSSPLTSRSFVDLLNTPEGSNPARLEGTLLTEQNFVKASITGSFLNNDRTVTFQAIDTAGTIRWTKSFHENDLKIPRGE